MRFVNLKALIIGVVYIKVPKDSETSIPYAGSRNRRFSTAIIITHYWT
jgi:hypothetical protein